MIGAIAGCVIGLFGLISFNCWQGQNSPETVAQIARFRCQDWQTAPTEWLDVASPLAELHAAFVNGSGSDPMGSPVGCPLHVRDPYGMQTWAITLNYGVYGLAIVDPWGRPYFHDRVAQMCWMISQPGQPLAMC